MEQNAQQIAKQLYPLAALYLGSLAEGRAALTEAIASAQRKSPAQWQSETLPALLRICQTRVPERAEQHDFPDDPAIAPLLPVLRLPAGSRRILALKLCGLPADDAAAACGITAGELEQKTEKALRQLTFLDSGAKPQISVLTEAAAQLPWSDEDTESLLSGLAEAKQSAEAEPVKPEITQKTAPSKKHHGKSVTLPLWAIVVGLGCIAGIFAVMFFRMTEKEPQPAEPPEIIRTETAESLLEHEYLRIGEAQTLAANAAGVPEAEAKFLNTKLKTTTDPVCYEISLTDGNVTQYLVRLDAKNGEIIACTSEERSYIPEMTDWLPYDTLRQTALAYANLSDAVFIKEKCASDGESGYCKYDLLDGAGKLYSIQLDAKTGRLMKYTVELLSEEEPKNVISPEQACETAVARVSDVPSTQVIFTKIKLESGLYTIAFTLDDGTQYLVELNAVTGAVNNVDVHPVSADVKQAVGILTARDTALRLADLQDDASVSFTKAKIDRSSGAYVYELEFETQDYEYEATISVQDGSAIRFRAWDQ